MYSQAPVLARALKTNPDPIGHTNPLRIKSPTLKTELKKEQDTILYAVWLCICEENIQDLKFILCKEEMLQKVEKMDSKFLGTKISDFFFMLSIIIKNLLIM